MGLCNKTKRIIGLGIWILSQRSSFLRRHLARMGMRTRMEWFERFTGYTELVNGKVAQLTNIHRNYLSFTLHWRGWKYYEPITMLLFDRLLTDAEMFIDIGANIGLFSLVAASKEPKVKTVAFEPNPKLFAILMENANANDFCITCESKAISDKCSTSEFYVPESDMSGSLEPDFSERHRAVHTVSTVTLDAYIEEHARPGSLLLKIDVEGHEQSVLRGARETLRNIRPDIIVEVVREYDETIEAMLKECGYAFYRIAATGFCEVDGLSSAQERAGGEFNFLVTVRTPDEVSHLYEQCRHRIETLDLSQSSLKGRNQLDRLHQDDDARARRANG